MPLRIALVLLILLAAPAQAHDLWVDAGYQVRGGHPGPQATQEPMERLVELRAYDADAALLPLSPTPAGLRPAQRPALLLAWLDQRLFSRPAQGGRYQPGLLPDAAEVRRLMRYSRTLLGAGAASSRVFGEGLELVPARDPAGLAAGSLVALGLYWQGRPLAGQRVWLDDGRQEQSALTDTSGLARLPWQPAALYRGEYRLREDERRLDLHTAVLRADYAAGAPP